MGQIFKGLAQTGAWGCFDEFNRIPVPVLSVCTTQYKSLLDALRAKRERFVFEGAEIALRPSAMAFITMNPGYIGRAELPESLKALFRPVSMAAPDLALICEIMLIAEGFQEAKALARKFIELHRLCGDLLSKARHYDWKLRAIKTTLRVAGEMRRAAPELGEDRVLLRALRDFNLGKLTPDDAIVFQGLLNDLFPRLPAAVPRRVDARFEAEVRRAARELGYQPDDAFCLKVSQLKEIFEVRWSVFLLGAPGCGKTAVWKTLARALNNLGEKTACRAINPKAVDRNELYGCIHPQSREWREGLLSSAFRDMAANRACAHQWIVLDGDIDPEWIESMNTVMDDNKMLTLASNERIPLASSMRLLLEIDHMNHCSPATVSRGGVVHMTEQDVGWAAALACGLDRLLGAARKAQVLPLVGKYVDKTLEFTNTLTYAIPVSSLDKISTLCKLLSVLVPAPGDDASSVRREVEGCFVQAMVWAFGGSLATDGAADHQATFSKWWRTEFRTVPFPPDGTVFDYRFDAGSAAFVPWEEGSQGADSSCDLISTPATRRLLGTALPLIAASHSVLLVGGPGTGKTALMRQALTQLSETCAFQRLALHHGHDGGLLQAALEACLEKKGGTRLGAPGSKPLVFWLDNLSAPGADKYETRSALELVRQAIDYSGWYDKARATHRDVTGCHFVACTNPAAGQGPVSQRLQHHFVALTLPAPGPADVAHILRELVRPHFDGFPAPVRELATAQFPAATADLHVAVQKLLHPTARKVHYSFTLKEIRAVAQGLVRGTPAVLATPEAAVQLWLHETTRIYADRLVSEGREFCLRIHWRKRVFLIGLTYKRSAD